ncbi:MAG: hypothetical protein LDL47_02385 [Cyanobacteria bacterium KgW148]|nr:hypothetical protein [Cyanobacteria bacterium KgW148]
MNLHSPLCQNERGVIPSCVTLSSVRYTDRFQLLGQTIVIVIVLVIRMKVKTLLCLFLTVFLPLTVYSVTPESNSSSFEPQGAINRSWLRLMDLH